MVKLAIDTNHDGIQDLEEAVSIITEAIARRKASVAVTHDEVHPPKRQTAQELLEETAVETPFFKIKVKDDDDLPPGPTLNEMMGKESITEDELTEMFKKNPEAPSREKKERPRGDAFIEIVEFDDEPSS